MKTVMVVSYGYLNALLQESDKFSFCIQGYGSFKNAHSGLIKTNISEIIGFAYVGETLPVENSEDYKAMLDFLEILEILEERRRIVFVTRSSGGYMRKLASKFSNLEIYRVEGVQDITDSVIKKDVFGNLLLSSGLPYRLTEQISDDIPYKQNDSWKLKFEHVINPDILKCLEDVTIYSDLNTTLDNDSIYKELLASGNNLLASIRQIFIIQKSGTEDKELVQHVKNMINSSVSGVDWCVFMSILEGVE